jgi:CRP-like cAMP-binding protein
MPLLTTLEKFCYKAHEIPKGTRLLKEGKSTHRTYVLVSGALKVTAGNVDIGSFTHAGDTFGEMATLLDENASADVTAEEDSQVYIIEDLKAFLLKNPQQAIDLLKQSYNRIQQMNKGVNTMLKMIP